MARDRRAIPLRSKFVWRNRHTGEVFEEPPKGDGSGDSSDSGDSSSDAEEPDIDVQTKRALVAAIVEYDCRRIEQLASEHLLPSDTAFALAKQAHNADVRVANADGEDTDAHQKAVVRDGGALCALCRGVRAVQPAESQEFGDNATTLLCSLAVADDDPSVLDALLDFSLGFSMAPRGQKFSVESTTEYFLSFDAPRCAQRFIEMTRNMRTSFTTREQHTLEHKFATILMRAKAARKRIDAAPPDNASDCDIATSAMDCLIYGPVGVCIIDIIPGITFTLGLSLLGERELCIVGPASRANTFRLLRTADMLLLKNAVPTTSKIFVDTIDTVQRVLGLPQCSVLNIQ